MITKFSFLFFLCFNCFLECINGDPGRDVCKIVPGPGLKCSKITSHLFPYDTFLSFNDDLAQFTTDMKYLEIGNSNISVLQARSFQRTPHLSQLVLRNIFLIELEPSAFEGLRRLKSVDLSYNLLQTIPIDVFKYAKLNRLLLEGNALLEIPDNSPFLNAKYLTYLSLKKCNVQHLSGTAFKQNPALMHLDLSQNYLQTLPEEIFANLQQLTFIDLSDNQFRSLEIEIFESMPRFPKTPETVILAGNPWMCDCKIAKLVDWSVRSPKTEIWSESPRLTRLKKMVECQNPKQLSWNSLELKEFLSSC